MTDPVPNPVATSVPDDAGFHRLIHTSAVGFWHIGVDGLTRYLNPAMCRMLEIDGPHVIHALTYHRFFTPRSLEVMQQEHHKRSTGAPSTYEVELIGMHGGRRNVMISGSPMINDLGTLDGLIGTFTDITGMRQAEATVRERDQCLRSLFDASMDAVGVACAGTHVLVNPAFLQLFGFTHPDEVLGTSIIDLIAADERAKIGVRIRQRSLGEPAANHYVTRGCRRDGSEFAMEVSVSSYQEGERIFTVAILRDITLRQRLEEQLRQAQKMDAIGLMAGGIAHDFNNLLTVIIGCSDRLVRRISSDDPAAANVAMINSTAQRAAALTKQLLTISRKEVITPQAVDLPDLLAELAPMLRQLLGPSVELCIECAPKTPAVLADPHQMHQVLINLSVNARDAMPSGGRLLITIAPREIATDHESLSPGTHVELAVIDAGTGMDAAVQARIFEPFFTTKGIGKGTGLGLSTVYSIVMQTGGTITVTSAPGHGSTFRVLLPLAAVTDQPMKSQAPQTSPPTPSRLHRILLVDDDENVRMLVAECLADAGFGVVACATPAAALERLRTNAADLDLVISDVVMPDMNGWEFARALDRLHVGKRLLLISGFSAEGMPPDIARRPLTSFISKPFTPSRLIAAVRTLLEQA